MVTTCYNPQLMINPLNGSDLPEDRPGRHAGDWRSLHAWLASLFGTTRHQLPAWGGCCFVADHQEMGLKHQEMRLEASTPFLFVRDLR